MEWEGILAIEGEPTGDGRFFERGAIRWRELPLTLLYMPATAEGHDGSYAVGRIDEIERVEASEGVNHILGRGVFDDSPEALEVAGMVADRVVRGVSVDMALDLFELAPMDEGVSLVPAPEDAEASLGAIRSHDTPVVDEPWDGPAMEARISNDAGAATLRRMYAWVDPDGDPEAKSSYKFPHHMVDDEGRIGAANLAGCRNGLSRLPQADIPADDRDGVAAHLNRHLDAGRDEGAEEDGGEASLALLEDEEDGEREWIQVENVVTMRVQEATIMAATIVATPAFAETDITVIGEVPDAVVASAAPEVPPAEWFADPDLERPTPLTVTPEGRVFGHLAAWGTCHIGMPGCFQPPPSGCDYALFRLGERETTGGPVPVGQVTLATNHAGLSLGAAAAREHYEHTGAAVADVACGEDPHGIWVAGALRPGLSPEQVAELRAAKLSGDWRDYRGNLEMVAALAVNVPGFPVPRGLVAGGERDRPLSLVAAGSLRAATATARVAGRFIRIRRPGATAGADVESFQALRDAFLHQSPEELLDRLVIQLPDTDSEAVAEAVAERIMEASSKARLRRLADRVHEPELAALAERL